MKTIKNSVTCIVIIISIANIGISQSNPARSDIKGFVKDMNSGEALPFANIVLKGTNLGTTTNTDGYFVLVNVPVGLCLLQVQYIGYGLKTIEVKNLPEGTAPLQIELKPTIINLQGVTVTAQAEMLDVSSKQISLITLSPWQLSSLPSLGEVDVFRSLQLLPGISGVSDGSSGLYVRGGTPDQNLVLFDGMTIYHVDHFFGFFSAFNAEAVKDIQLIKGGFQSEYGGRLSSVVNLTGKTGNKNKRQFGYGLNLLSGNAFFETPLFGDKGTFLIAGRRSYTDFIRSPLYDKIYGFVTGEDGGATGGPVQYGSGGGSYGVEGEFKPSFYFYDLNSKLTLNPSTKDVFTFSFYSGKDDLDKSQEFDNMGFQERDTDTDVSLSTEDYSRWGNLGFSGKWSRQWHDRFHVDLLGAYSKYFSEYDRSANMTVLNFSEDDSSSNIPSFYDASEENNKVKDLSIKLDADWQISQSNRLDFGLHSSQFDNKFTSTRNDTITILSKINKTMLHAMYLQDQWKVKSLEITLGLRSSYYDETSSIYYEPRASFNYQLTDNLLLKGGWGQYYQFVNEISTEDVTQGARNFWLLADDEFKPGYAEHNIIGFNYDNNSYVFGLEAYYKDLKNVIEFSRRFVGREGVEENFFIGNGEAMGLEFLAMKKRGALTGWIGYTLGKVDYTFPRINDGETFPANHDRRHEINIVTKYTRGVYTFAATWVFASGNPYTSPVSQYFIPLLDGETQSYIHVSDKNSQYLPDYHRLDLSVSRKFESEHWATELGVSIFNAYNHKNVWYRDYNLDTTPITVTDVLMLGFTPTLYIKMNLK